MISIQDEASLEELFARLRAVEQAHAHLARQLATLSAQLSRPGGHENANVLTLEPLSAVQEAASALSVTSTKDSKLAKLTARERQVLHLVAQGLHDAEVAERLVLTRRTVNWYLSSIYSKLGVSSRSAATRYAIEHNLV